MFDTSMLVWSANNGNNTPEQIQMWSTNEDYPNVLTNDASSTYVKNSDGSVTFTTTRPLEMNCSKNNEGFVI